jgi:hypothetical protein
MMHARIDAPAASDLAEQSFRGAELIGMAAMVCDQGDFHIWRHRRDSWLRAATLALAGDDELAPTIERLREVAIVSQPAADWRAALPLEVQALEDATDILRRLSHRP